MNKRGMSTVVGIVIMLLLCIIAIGLTGIIVINTLKTNSEGVVIEKTSVDFEIMSVKEGATNTQMNVEIKRNPGAGEVTEIKITTTFNDGTSLIESGSTMKELEEKEFIIDLNEKSKKYWEVEKVTVTPVIKSKITNKEILGYEDPYKKNIDGSCTPDCTGVECGLDPVCGTQNCGSCDSGYNCIDGICVATCVPETCLSLGKECGIWDDGCGTQLDCGPTAPSCIFYFGTCGVDGTKTCLAGGTYGTCSTVVVDPRIANCAGKVCGDNRCGGFCSGTTCVDYLKNINGLISWWRFEGNMNDNKGTNTGTCTNCPTLTTDKFENPNSAYYFDGTKPNSKNINLGNPTNLDLSNSQFTIGLWVYLSSLQPYSMAPFYCDGSSRLSFGMDKTTYKLQVYRNGPNSYLSNTAITPNEWNYVAVTYDGKFNFYKNGAPDVSSSSISPAYTLPSTKYIGYSGFGQPFKGRIDELMVFNRALSPTEIQQMYNLFLQPL